MRAREIASLTWGHIHFDKRIAHLPITKNGTSRNVPLSSKAIEILKRLESIKADDSVFQLDSKSISAIFYKTKTELGLNHLDFHNTRREVLSRLTKKVDIMTLAKISGHKDIKILLTPITPQIWKKLSHYLIKVIVFKCKTTALVAAFF